MECLPNEIWSKIIGYISLKDVLSLRFLSKRFYNIFLLNSKIRYFYRVSNEIIDTEKYYNQLKYSLGRLSNVLKYTLDFSDYVFLIYSFEELINSSLISILLLHLFDCPRTMFAKSTCLNCSRNFIEVNIIKPSNFKIVSNSQFISFFDLTALPDESQDVAKDFRTIVLFETYQQK